MKISQGRRSLFKLYCTSVQCGQRFEEGVKYLEIFDERGVVYLNKLVDLEVVEVIGHLLSVIL